MKKWSKRKKAGVAAVVVMAVVVVAVAISGTGNAQSSKFLEVQPVVQDMRTYLKFSGNIEAAKTASVYADVSAKVLQLLVEEGDEVKQGDVIAVLDSSDAEYQITLKEANLRDAKRNDAYTVKDSQRKLDNYEEGIAEGYDTSLNSAQKSLLSAQEDYQSKVDAYNLAKDQLENGTNSSIVNARQALDSQTVSYENAQSQHEDNMMTDEAFKSYQVSYDNACESYRLAVENAQRELEDKEASMKKAEESLAAAERDYEASIRTAGQNQESYEDNLAKAQASAAEETANMELEHLKETLDDYTIYAPMDGTVTKLNIQEGDMAANSAVVAQMADFSVMQVAIKIDEQDVLGVSEGAAVSVYVGALDKTYEGKITDISKTAVNENNAVYVEAVAEFAADDDVRSGFGAEVQLVRASAQDAICLPSDAVRYDVDNSAYVLVKDEKGNPEKRSVVLGISDGNYVQIKEGLSAEETVLSDAASFNGAGAGMVGGGSGAGMGRGGSDSRPIEQGGGF